MGKTTMPEEGGVVDESCSYVVLPVPWAHLLVIDTMDILPVPDEAGIQKMKELYKRRFNMELSHAEAADILGRLMRFIYLTSSLPTSSNPDVPDVPPTE